MNYATQPEIVGTESLAFIDQTLISVIEFRLRHLHAIKKHRNNRRVQFPQGWSIVMLKVMQKVTVSVD